MDSKELFTMETKSVAVTLPTPAWELVEKYAVDMMGGDVNAVLSGFIFFVIQDTITKMFSGCSRVFPPSELDG